MEFPFLVETAIDGEAAALLAGVFGGPWRERKPVDLETVVYEHLSPRENLMFNDEADLPMKDGEVVLGKTLPVKGKILINRVLKKEPERGRFTLAHELGHWVLHRKLFLARRETIDLFERSGVDSDFEFVGLNRSVFPASCRPNAVPREEWQANRFAVALLINPTVLREEFELRFGTAVIARSNRDWGGKARTMRALSSLLCRETVCGHRPLRDVFGLSVEAMAIALESRGYVVEEAPGV